jgi:hypothetical protein
MFLGLCSIAVILLVTSSVTAVPQTRSISVMSVLNNLQQKKAILEEKISKLKKENNANETPLLDLLILILGLIISIVAIIAWIVGHPLPPPELPD